MNIKTVAVSFFYCRVLRGLLVVTKTEYKMRHCVTCSDNIFANCVEWDYNVMIKKTRKNKKLKIPFELACSSFFDLQGLKAEVYCKVIMVFCILIIKAVLHVLMNVFRKYIFLCNIFRICNSERTLYQFQNALKNHQCC